MLSTGRSLPPPHLVSERFWAEKLLPPQITPLSPFQIASDVKSLYLEQKKENLSCNKKKKVQFKFCGLWQLTREAICDRKGVDGMCLRVWVP